MSKNITQVLHSKFNSSPGYPFCQPGDIFFARGTGMMGRMIRWAEREKGEAESWANHVGGVMSEGYLVPPAGHITALATTTESLWKIEESVWWERHRHEQGYAVAVFRPRNYSGNEGVEKVLDDWHSRLGQKYGWWRLTTFLGEKLSHEASFGLFTIPFTKLHFQGKRIVCSNHIFLGLEKDDIRVNSKDPNELDPDDAMDYCIAHEADEFKLIGQAIVPARRPA
jgi:hypothetical protein